MTAPDSDARVSRVEFELARFEVIGDCCLNGEPSSPWTLRFGEKGPLWLEFAVRTKGAHG